MREESTNRIAEVEFIAIRPREGVIGFASCTFDGVLYLGSIAVHTKLEGGGLRITYPTRKVGKSNIPIFHPLRKEVGIAIQQAITQKVEELMGQYSEE